MLNLLMLVKLKFRMSGIHIGELRQTYFLVEDNLRRSPARHNLELSSMTSLRDAAR